MEQLNPVSPGAMGWGCLNLLLILPLEESSHGSSKLSEWPRIQLHCLIANGRLLPGQLGDGPLLFLTTWRSRQLI